MEQSQIQSTEYHLIVSHNNRIQSWLDPLLQLDGKMITKYNENKKIRFSNCAAISLQFSDSGLTISLVDSGDSSSNKRGDIKSMFKKYAYWVTTIPHDAQSLPFNPILFEEVRIPYVEGTLASTNIEHLKRKNFLLVRHGEALHNVVKIANLRTDTELTPKGLLQGWNLGQRLLDKNILLSKTCYVSDLLRTVMTAWAIGKSYEINQGDLSYFTSYVVVPCNHEISDESGTEVVGRNYMIQNENKSLCTFMSNGKFTSNSCERKFSYTDNTGKKIEIDLTLNLEWSYYKNHYRISRMDIESGEGENPCTRSSFLIELNTIFARNTRPVTVGSSSGGLKKRKNKKQKTQKKHRKQSKKHRKSKKPN